MSFHKVTIVGNLGRDPELRYMKDGTAVCSLSVAATENWKDKSGQRQERTVWFRVTAWGRLAENVNQYLAKGRKVYIEGSLKPGDDGSPRVYEKKDGTPGASYELTASVIHFLDSKTNGVAPDDDDDDDSPF